HRHIAQTYRFDDFRDGFVNILAAEQNVENRDWYQGTADAVRQNLDRLTYLDTHEVLVLSGDQLYSMDLGEFVGQHRQRRADVSIAVKPVDREEARGLGIMRVDETGRIVEFVEKPQDDAILDDLALPGDALQALGFDAEDGSLLASMGIYVFGRRTLEELLLGSQATDFGREVIPSALESCRVFAYGYQGYWRDIGTIPAFHRANLELAAPLPPLNLYDPLYPIFTHPRYLPGTKVDGCSVTRSILCEGSVLTGSRIFESIVGIRAQVRAGSTLERTILMGATSYLQTEEQKARPIPRGVGKECYIRDAIIDTNARVGDGCQLVNERGVEDEDGEFHFIRGGIIVIPRDAEVPPGTVI
ncbi:MAG: glucose-1-phosphate adenylyltransferase, partial [Acidobacteria bacterium]|nr:glucose-1-phosphate adenylyltransferase [Acidobacteriota bacterium]